MTADRTVCGFRGGAKTPGGGTLAVWVRQPWLFPVAGVGVLIRGATGRDLPAIGALHGRCSRVSLLRRYGRGGERPSHAALELTVRRPLSFVAAVPGGQIVATAVAGSDPSHDSGCARAGVLVQDDWQGRGIGRELVKHLAGSVFACGFGELVSYPADEPEIALRLLAEIGTTRAFGGIDSRHLHTYLTEQALLGLGAVRDHHVG